MSEKKLVIFDCDGVLINSESIAQTVLLSLLAEQGVKVDIANDGSGSDYNLVVKMAEYLNAVGEVIGWIFDQNGNMVDCALNDRLASTPLHATDEKLIYAIAAGKKKIGAIRGALNSSLINCLITNEYTAEKLLNYK